MSGSTASGGATRRFQKATEAVALARELNDQYSEMVAHREAAMNCMLEVRDASREHAWAAREIAERLHHGQAILERHRRADIRRDRRRRLGRRPRSGRPAGSSLNARWIMLLAPMAEAELHTGNLERPATT